MPKISSPLRYPGGKSRAIGKIWPLVPDYREFREPFVGGGSVFLAAKQELPDRQYWINDLNTDLFHFWEQTRTNLGPLVEAVRQIQRATEDGCQLFNSYQDNWHDLDDFERAVRFFVLNRISFSGTVDSGGYSNQAFHKRFTASSIDRLARLQPLMQNVRISNLDYRALLEAPGDEVFIFLDPPYYSTTNSRLYGKDGDLHTGFDHQAFAKNMRACQHRWLITYDDCPEIRELFAFAHLQPWSLQYGMNNYKQGSAGRGRELFIANYDLPPARDRP